MAIVRMFGHGADLSRREEAARGFAPVPMASSPGQQIRRLLLIFATTTGVSLLALIGLLFYGAVLGF